MIKSNNQTTLADISTLLALREEVLYDQKLNQTSALNRMQSLEMNLKEETLPMVNEDVELFIGDMMTGGRMSFESHPIQVKLYKEEKDAKEAAEKAAQPVPVPAPVVNPTVQPQIPE